MLRNFNHITKLLLLTVVFVQVAGMLLPFTGDAGKYAAISKNIYNTREFWDVSIHGSPYYQKPPLMMWLSAAGFYLTGTINSFTSRLLPVLATLLMLWAVYQLGKRYYTKQTGIIAALFTGTTQIFFLYTTDLHTDALLTSFTTAAIWQLALYIDKRKWINFFGGFVFTGLAMLTKGPVGLAVPAFAIGAQLIYRRNFKAIFRPEWLLGVFLLFIMLLPHLRFLYGHYGWEGVNFYFWTNNAGRITGSYRGSSTDKLFYVYNLLIFTLPWSVFFFGGLLNAFIRMFKRKKIEEFYTIGGALVFLVVLSFSKMKSTNYFYPAITLLALPAAHFFISIINNSKHKYLTWIQSLIILLIFIGLTILSLWMFPLKNILIWVFLFFLLIISLLVMVFDNNLASKMVNISLAGIVAINLIINLQILPEIFKFQSSLKAAEIYNSEAEIDEKFYTYRYTQFEMFFYANSNGYKIVDERHKDERLFTTLNEALSDDAAWFLTDRKGYRRIRKSDAAIDKIYIFDHYYLTEINWNFLNPKTRDDVLKKMYLIKTTGKQ